MRWGAALPFDFNDGTGKPACFPRLPESGRWWAALFRTTRCVTASRRLICGERVFGTDEAQY